MRRRTTNANRTRLGVVVSATLVLLASCWSLQVSAQSVRRPTRRALAANPALSTPEAQGMSSETLADGIEYLIANRETYRVHGVTVIRNGRLVLNAPFYPFSPQWGHDIASVTKSVMSTLVGIAIDQSFLAGIESSVLDFFPDHTIANRDALKESMTIDDLLRMRSGFECDASNSEATLTEMTNSPNWIQFALDLPMAESPGERFNYCSPNIHLLSAILQRSTGMTTLEFAQRYLFDPLGITDVEWLIDPQGLHRGWGDLHLRPVDLPKLGLLYLNGGRWRGRQLVSSWWIQEATVATRLPLPGWPEGHEYAYLWYSAPGQIYAAGRGGQRIHVYPDENLVVGLNAGSGIGDFGVIPTSFLDTYVLGAIESDDPLPDNPDGVARLAAGTAEAASSNEGPPQEVEPLPAIAQAISGRTYVLEDNIYGLSEVRLTCPGGNEATLEVGLPEIIGGPVLDLQIGLDGVNRFSPGRHGVMTAASGGWVSDTLFSAVVDELALINLWQWDLTFAGDTVTLELTSLAGGELPATVTGTMAR